MPKLIIINGYAGTGKSSVSTKLAQKNKIALIQQDTFLFQMNAIINPKETTTEDHTLAIQNMFSCVKNYLEKNRDVIMEGALVSISQKDPLDLREFIKFGVQNNCKVIVFTFTAKNVIRLQRMENRGYIVPKKIDKLLRNATNALTKKIKNGITIDTTTKEVEEIIDEIESHL